MWLLLVAAGSGYLARCWHRTLRTKPQLTDYAHVDSTVTREEQPSTKSSSEGGLEESIANASVKSFTANLGTESAPKPVKRTFSPKAISKKLFSLESSKSKQVAKREAKAKSFTGDGSASAVDSGVETSSASGKRSPWSSFKSKKSHSSKGGVRLEENSGDSSAGYPNPPSESLSIRKAGKYGSSSSRSLQDYFNEELDSAGSMLSSPGQSGRSLPGAFADTEVVETSEDSRSGNLQDVTRYPFRPKVEADYRLKVQEPPGSLSTETLENVENALDNDSSSRREVPTSVAEAVAQIEKGNLSSKVESVNAASSHGSGSKSRRRGTVTVWTLDSERKEQIPVEEVDSFGGGKGKRRANAASKVNLPGSKVALSAAVLTGKRIKDNKDHSNDGTGESPEVTLASITGKRIKDGDKEKEYFEEHEKLSPSIAGGIVDLSQVFFGFDNTFLGSTAEEKSPTKFYKKSRYTVRAGAKANVRKMRESPRPVSALESCLRAQFPDKEEGSRVARALSFSSLTSSSVSRRDKLEPSLDGPYLGGESLSVKVTHDGTEQDGTKSEGALGLPLLKAIPSKRSVLRGTSESSGTRHPEPKYPRRIVLEKGGKIASSQFKLNDVLWRPTILPVAPKKRKVSQACSTAATSSTNARVKGYELEALVIPPMEGLLFSFGVGIGVMSLAGEPEKEVERLSKELQKSENEIRNLNEALKAAKTVTLEATKAQLSKQVMVVGSLAVEKVTGEMSGNNDLHLNRLGINQSTEDVGIDLFDLVRKEAPETPQQTEHMAELEAELEAELDALTGGIADGWSGLLDFDELDPEGIAGLANRDLGVEGLPALLDWDDDNDDFITEEHTQCGGVPPRELRRLLRKVQSSRQELRIAELEIDLQESAEKLQTMEKELQLLRETMMVVRPQSPSVESVETDVRDLSGALSTEGTNSADGATSSPQLRKDDGVPSKEEESVRRDHHFDPRAIVIPNTFQDSENLSDQPILSLSPKWESAAGLRASLSRKLGSSPLRSWTSKQDSSLQRSASVELGSTLRKQTSIELGSSLLRSPVGRLSDVTRPEPSDLALLRGSTSSLTPKELALATPVVADKGDHSQAHDNDAVCDEFLSSVFGSSEEEDNRSVGSSVVSHPTLLKTFSLDDGFASGEEEKSLEIVDPQALLKMVRAKSTEEDLDQVADKLLKRDSSSVKNAINAFLQWEAETDEKQEKEDQPGSVGGTSPLYLRRTAGKYTTPQKTISSSSSPLRTAVLASRLEELAKTTLSTNEMTYPDTIGFSPKRRGGHGKTKKLDDEDLEVFQPPEPQPEDRSSKTSGRRDYQLTKKDHSPRTREGRKSMTENRRELFRTESPVFGSVDVDLDSLMDMRREKRYSSTKVELSSSVPPRERDVIPSGYMPREDSSRAGTNSPTERQSPSVKMLYPSPKPKSSRSFMDKRLYHNLTSDWYAEGTSPTDKNRGKH